MKLTLAESLGYSILGIAVVFLMLALLMGVIFVMGKAMVQKKKEPKEAPAPAPAPAPAAPAPAAGKVPARGSLGDVDLHSVDDRTAALLMAIVADKMGAPLNELRFISIKEIQ